MAAGMVEDALKGLGFREASTMTTTAPDDCNDCDYLRDCAILSTLFVILAALCAVTLLTRMCAHCHFDVTLSKSHIGFLILLFLICGLRILVCTWNPDPRMTQRGGEMVVKNMVGTMPMMLFLTVFALLLYHVIIVLHSIHLAYEPLITFIEVRMNGRTDTEGTSTTAGGTWSSSRPSWRSKFRCRRCNFYFLLHGKPHSTSKWLVSSLNSVLWVLYVVAVIIDALGNNDDIYFEFYTWAVELPAMLSSLIMGVCFIGSGMMLTHRLRELKRLLRDAAFINGDGGGQDVPRNGSEGGIGPIHESRRSSSEEGRLAALALGSSGVSVSARNSWAGEFLPRSGVEITRQCSNGVGWPFGTSPGATAISSFQVGSCEDRSPRHTSSSVISYSEHIFPSSGEALFNQAQSERSRGSSTSLGAVGTGAAVTSTRQSLSSRDSQVNQTEPPANGERPPRTSSPMLSSPHSAGRHSRLGRQISPGSASSLPPARQWRLSHGSIGTDSETWISDGQARASVLQRSLLESLPGTARASTVTSLFSKSSVSENSIVGSSAEILSAIPNLETVMSGVRRMLIVVFACTVAFLCRACILAFTWSLWLKTGEAQRWPGHLFFYYMLFAEVAPIAMLLILYLLPGIHAIGYGARQCLLGRPTGRDSFSPGHTPSWRSPRSSWQATRSTPSETFQ